MEKPLRSDLSPYTNCPRRYQCGNCVVVQLPTHVWLFSTPWTAAHQAFLPLTVSWTFPKFMCIALVMVFRHLILCHSLVLLPSNLSQHQGLFQWVICSYQMNEILELQLKHQSFQGLYRTDFLRMDWLDLLAVQGLSRVFSNTTVQKHQFWDFPGGWVVKTPCFPCRRHGFHSWSGN